MAALELKAYQRESLQLIGELCSAVRQRISRAEFPVHDAYRAATGRDYIDVPQLPGVPYVCLRVPTGGGKTLIAAHAIGAIAKHLGHQDRPLCLWVTPNTIIRDQTLRGLRNREHAYHLGLREGLGSAQVEVLTIEEALSANRAILSSSAVVVVTTIQSYRIDEEANRKVYQDNGYLMDNFSAIPAWLRQHLVEPDTGRVALSLANVMKLRGPIVIMDEAHNARSRISFDSLARFGPLAVLELTATPQQEHDPSRDLYASNVLHAVSALQLSREGMIKLPIELESRANWLDVLAATKDRREALEQRAKEWGRQTGRFIRPIALIQAQPRSKARETQTVEIVKAALIEKLKIDKENVRIVAYEIDEIGEEDLHAPNCKVEYIVTVEKLRQGWDCPFAYVLGSIGNVATETAVEQLLGRVLRMPDALPTGVAELDRAYAIVQSPDVVKTAKSLCDSLVSFCGFDVESVADAFRVHRHVDPQGRLPLDTISLSEPPNVERLPASMRGKIKFDAASGRLQIRENLTQQETIALRDVLDSPADRAAVESFWQAERPAGTAVKNLNEYAQPLRVPQMIVRHGERSYLFEPEELDEFSWNLDRCEAALAEADFKIELDLGDRVTLGLAEQGGVRIGGVEEVIVRQLSFVADDENWSDAELVRWLDAELHRGGAFAGLPKSESQAWFARVVDNLLTARTASLPIVVRNRHDLANVVIQRVAAHGRQQVRLAADALIDNRSPRRLETSLDAASVLEEQGYCPYRQYRGTYALPKHAFELIGEMGKDDEPDCAKRIDAHPNVKRWIRNLSHESAGGFSLPLSPGRFFPDFIAELNDGRIAIIEYKNRLLAQDADEDHKRKIGELWESRSEGKCVFVWVVEKDWETLDTKLQPTA